MTAIVTDYSNHFAWMKNSTWFRDAQAKSAAGETVDYINPDSSEMADWTSGNLDALKSAENADNVKALVEFLAAEAGHAGTTYDAALVEKGRDLAINGTWAGALKDTSCASCHDTIGQDFPANPDDSAAGTLSDPGKVRIRCMAEGFYSPPRCSTTLRDKESDGRVFATKAV